MEQDAAEDDYICAICISVLYDPVQTACGHHYCGICAGYVDPATLVVMGKPRATVWCNRRPRALDTYEKLFAEVGCGQERLTSAVGTVMTRGKIAKFRDMLQQTKDFDLKSKVG